jgi:O-methyltransferase domain/Dimerisation domain
MSEPRTSTVATPPINQQLLQMIMGYRRTQVVNVAARLRLADELADGPRTAADLATATGTDLTSLRRLLRALACVGVVEEQEPDRFALTDVGRPLREDVEGSMRNLVMLFCEQGNWNAWGDMETSVRTGTPALERLSGQRPFDYLAGDRDRSENFNKAMGEYTKITINGVVASYDFGRFGTVVDVGGNDGTLLAAILVAYPAVRGILFDSPSGVKESPEVLEAAGVADRVEVVAGSFFESVPTGGDAYVLKSIVHDWSDEKAVEILRTVRRSMRADATLLLVESVLPDRIAAPGGVITGTVMMDLNMLVTTGGRERTRKDFEAMLTAAGFAVVGLSEPVEGNNYRVIEARPA